MKIAVFLNCVGLGGTEKAAAIWANALLDRGHTISLLALQTGPGLIRFNSAIPYHEVKNAEQIAVCLRRLRPDVIHAHQPGFPHIGDVLGQSLRMIDFKIPVVQTNVFGRLENPEDNAWVTGRAFVSWTSCVQAAQRAGKNLDKVFFRNATVISNPVPSVSRISAEAIATFRKENGILPHEVVMGKLSRPDMNKWSELAMDGFILALNHNNNIKFLIREAPSEVLAKHGNFVKKGILIPLPMTSDEDILKITISSIDVLLHSSSIGESFGYGIAEAMNLGKPVITNSTPGQDQAQLELVKHGVCGFIANTPQSICRRILTLASDANLRASLGGNAALRIRQIADVDVSVTRLESLLKATVTGRDNPFLNSDIQTAVESKDYLEKYQHGQDVFYETSLKANNLVRKVLSKIFI